MLNIDAMLLTMVANGGSDLHLMAGQPARVRRHGKLAPIDSNVLKNDILLEALTKMMTPKAKRDLEETEGADFAHAIEDKGRFRVNILRHLGGIGAVMRAIPARAMSLSELNLPPVIGNMCKAKQGLILVTGKTGSGKSTTLAAMVDEINRTRKGHILTIEDPIEFTHERQQSLISQRQVGVHTPSFAEALHSAMREDPDVILVGEMRDLETISIAVTAAETGILVMGTLHTNGAAPTVDRIINTFPADKQPHIRSMISTSLRGVVSQQLIPKAAQDGRVAALEILVNNAAVGNLVRQGKLDALENTMQSGALVGMQTMDSAIRKLLEGRMITGEDAYEKAFNKQNFANFAPNKTA
ncbi:MAG: PilT/PilU family type 4a pilus ATPase [Pseudomonadota bacterium]